MHKVRATEVAEVGTVTVRYSNAESLVIRHVCRVDYLRTLHRITREASRQNALDSGIDFDVEIDTKPAQSKITVYTYKLVSRFMRKPLAVYDKEVEIPTEGYQSIRFEAEAKAHVPLRR